MNSRPNQFAYLRRLTTLLSAGVQEMFARVLSLSARATVCKLFSRSFAGGNSSSRPLSRAESGFFVERIASRRSRAMTALWSFCVACNSLCEHVRT